MSVHLTTRQLTVLDHAARGRSVAEASGLMGVGQSTVKQHLADARVALGARTTTEAVALAVSLGMVEVRHGQTSRLHKIRVALQTADGLLAELV